MTAAHGSATMRNIPDVALTADVQIFLICNNGQWIEVGGTSAAAPLWAGFLALANQQAAADKKPRSRVPQSHHLRHRRGSSSHERSSRYRYRQQRRVQCAARLRSRHRMGHSGGPTSDQRIDRIDELAGLRPVFIRSRALIAPGTSGASTITVSAQQGFSNAVNLTVSGLPPGVTAIVQPCQRHHYQHAHADRRQFRRGRRPRQLRSPGRPAP